MSAASEELEYPWPPPLLNWDWWPLARLLTVCLVFGAAGHGYLGWHVDLATIVTAPRRIFEVLSLFAVISFGLAHLYLILLMFPLYAAVVLNERLYDLSRWLCVAVFRVRRGAFPALFGLCGEIAMFAGIALAVRRLFVG